MGKLQNQQGLLIGYTIGNSVGNGYINCKRKNLLKLKCIVQKENLKFNLEKGEISDDVKLSIIILRKLIKSKIIYNEEDFLELYTVWATKCNKYYFNNGFLKILISLISKSDKITLDDIYKKTHNLNYSHENNTFFVRIVPIVFWIVSSNVSDRNVSDRNVSIEIYLKKLITQNCKLCHPNNYCIEAAYIFGLFLYYSMIITSKQEIFEKVLEKVNINYHKQLITNSKNTPNTINKIAEDTTIDIDSNLCCRYYVSLQCVLYNFYNGRDFKSCLENTIKYGGDTSTNGAMIGAMAGAFYSMHNIPFKLINYIEISKKNKLGDLILLSGHKILLNKSK